MSDQYFRYSYENFSYDYKMVEKFLEDVDFQEHIKSLNNPFFLQKHFDAYHTEDGTIPYEPFTTDEDERDDKLNLDPIDFFAWPDEMSEDFEYIFQTKFKKYFQREESSVLASSEKINDEYPVETGKVRLSYPILEKINTKQPYDKSFTYRFPTISQSVDIEEYKKLLKKFNIDEGEPIEIGDVVMAIQYRDALLDQLSKQINAIDFYNDFIIKIIKVYVYQSHRALSELENLIKDLYSAHVGVTYFKDRNGLTQMALKDVKFSTTDLDEMHSEYMKLKVEEEGKLKEIRNHMGFVHECKAYAHLCLFSITQWIDGILHRIYHQTFEEFSENQSPDWGLNIYNLTTPIVANMTQKGIELTMKRRDPYLIYARNIAKQLLVLDSFIEDFISNEKIKTVEQLSIPEVKGHYHNRDWVCNEYRKIKKTNPSYPDYEIIEQVKKAYKIKFRREPPGKTSIANYVLECIKEANKNK